MRMSCPVPKRLAHHTGHFSQGKLLSRLEAMTYCCISLLQHIESSLYLTFEGHRGEWVHVFLVSVIIRGEHNDGRTSIRLMTC